jgi:hypothetical protein
MLEMVDSLGFLVFDCASRFGDNHYCLYCTSNAMFLKLYLSSGMN